MTSPSRRFPGANPFIGRSLREAFHLLMAELDQGIARDHPEATPGSNRVMVFIDREGTTVSELARRCRTTRQSTLEHVQRLEHHGYVIRTDHPHDRRKQLVKLTAKGHDAIADGFSVMQDVNRRWTEAIGPKNMSELIGLLDLLVTEVGARQIPPTR